MPALSAPRPTGGRGPLGGVLQRFAATVSGTFSAEDVLRELAEAAVELLGVDGAGVMVPKDDGLLRFVFATGDRLETVAALEQLQEELRSGPCRDSQLSGSLINIADLGGEGDWPSYQRYAVGVGMRAVTTVPLRARGRSWGVLDLYRSEPRALDEQELDAARTLADLATSYLVVTEDRDIARDAQEQLAHRAMHDPLTDLPVRWVFLEQLQHALARLARHPGHVGVLFIDLDGLKYVNDTYGHRAGDELILTCVHRLRAAVRPTDVVARLGGDEFVVLLEEIDADAATRVAARILTGLARPYQPNGEVLQPSASVGLALTDDPAQTPDTLIAHADSAMYRAKAKGRGRFELFDPTAYRAERRAAAERDTVTAALRTAVSNGELAVHYQPILDLTDHDPDLPRVHAVEALLRWHHPERGLLSAADFIPVAEQAGIMLELGTWMISAACRQLAEWDRALAGRSPAHLFLNASVQELRRPELAEHLAATLRDTGVAPQRVTLEVTESGLVTDDDAAHTSVDALTRLGCRLAIDDFGIGYSSLSRLLRLPAETIKIDKSITRAVPGTTTATAVISAVLLLGRELDRTIVVEGVEDRVQLDALRALGCRHAQGYHLARPLPPEQVVTLLGGDLVRP